MTTALGPEHNQPPPVVTIDGPSGTGKGTLATRLARALSWHLLDSGAWYRALGFAALAQGIDCAAPAEIDEMLAHAEIELHSDAATQVTTVWHAGQDITQAIRSESCAQAASLLAVLPRVRAYLLTRFQAMQQSPGLVADGRDMGSVVFTEATAKFYLDATIGSRSERRYKQLKSQGVDVNLAAIRDELQRRDARDQSRASAPMVCQADMVYIDTSELSIEAVFAVMWEKLSTLGFGV